MIPSINRSERLLRMEPLPHPWRPFTPYGAAVAICAVPFCFLAEAAHP